MLREGGIEKLDLKVGSANADRTKMSSSKLDIEKASKLMLEDFDSLVHV